MSNESNTPKNENQIRLFKSSSKKSEKSPDFWGKLNIGEVEYELAMWNNVSKTGTQYISGFVNLDVEDEADAKSKTPVESILPF
jgi:uncharacterized protein (DUF736 family)